MAQLPGERYLLRQYHPARHWPELPAATRGEAAGSRELEDAINGNAWDSIRTVLPGTPNKPNGDSEPFEIPNMYIGPVVERRKQRSLYLSGWRTGSEDQVRVSL